MLMGGAMLKLITAATTLPVSVARAKERHHIETSDYDVDIEALILAATGVVEDRTGLTLQTSSWEYRTHCWPCWNRPLQIPAAPVGDVTGVSYLDIDGVEQTLALSAEEFRWNRTAEGADIFFASGFAFPDLFCDPQAVRVQFTAGFDDPAQSGSGDDPELVLPPKAELAVLFLIGTWYENRESVGAQKYPVPDTLDALLAGLKVFR